MVVFLKYTKRKWQIQVFTGQLSFLEFLDLKNTLYKVSN